MNIYFNIAYHTQFGEVLVLNVISSETASATPLRMTTTDGNSWFLNTEISSGQSGYLIYYYSVERDGVVIRNEWKLVPHRICIDGCGTAFIRVFDHWNDFPEDSYMYSCAFCHITDERPSAGLRYASGTFCLKVRTSGLASGQRLALVGDTPSLGMWGRDGVLPMENVQPGEWCAFVGVDRLERMRIEFKFVILDGEGRISFWELGQNRYLILPELADGECVSYELLQPSFDIPKWKGAGTVIPVFSLRSEGSFGVGDFGDLKLMIDWCARTGQQALQILPVNDTTINHTWTDSYPYNSISIYALHPQYVDLRQLPQIRDASLREHYEALRVELNALPRIDYERVSHAKTEYLKEIFVQEGRAVLKSEAFFGFFDRNKDWLVPYAAFCTFRDKYGTAVFSRWPEHHTFTEEDRKQFTKRTTAVYRKASFWYFVQFVLDGQMRAAHEHARDSHVILKGDIPIGISRDGVEAWVEPRYFNLDGQAGAPPDAFSVNGQNWGFPTYDWDAMLRDGCSWWIRRFRKMAEYFDAYRIDHVLGFFRIWEIPIDSVHGLLGQFSPSLAMSRQEIEDYGLNFQEDRFLRPFITDWTLARMFGDEACSVRFRFLDRLDDERYRMKPDFDTQRKVEAWWKAEDAKLSDVSAKEALASLRDGLYAMISDVLFVRDHRYPELFHPRIGVQMDFIYESLYDCDKNAFNHLYNDYFYHRNNQFWYEEAMKKLPLLTEATRMLVCAEDLGMVPECVPWVMNQLHILSLEIQSMPREDNVRFGRLESNPYRSVCTISTHDMSTLRQWWDEDEERTQVFYQTVLLHDGAAPHPLTDSLAEEVVSRHLLCPSMLCLLSLQDWLSINSKARLADQNAERINIPANPRHYWRYRMHLTIEQLLLNDDLNRQILNLISSSGR